MSSALRIVNLTKSFQVGFIPKKVHVLNGISLEVEKGEIFGLLGPNGAGKTTTIKCILSLIRSDSGTIELLGEPIPSRRAKAKIGYLSENPYVYDFLSGREYLIFSASLYGMDRATASRKADEYLEFFQLSHVARTPLRKYSKGMLQKVGLAQALIHDPDFLILDEPMSGLDPIGRKEVRDLMLSLKSKGRTLLFSSHILSDAELLCDRVAILIEGSLRTTGSLQDLTKKIHGYEVTLSSKGSIQLDGLQHEMIASSGTQTLIRVPSINEIDQILILSKTSEFQIESIVPLRQTLEEIYLKQTKA